MLREPFERILTHKDICGFVGFNHVNYSRCSRDVARILIDFLVKRLLLSACIIPTISIIGMYLKKKYFRGLITPTVDIDTQLSTLFT